MELKRGVEARQLWENLVARSDDRWKASAMISLWVVALEEDRLDDADALYDALSVQFSVADLAVRIPATTRRKVVTVAVDPVVVGSLRPHPHSVRNLERALAAQREFAEPTSAVELRGD